MTPPATGDHAQALLRCEALVADIGARRVLEGITARFEPGTVTVVVGPNGAGKTTLLRALAGQIPITSGTVMLGDRPLASLSPLARGRAVAYLPQARTIDWPLAVEDCVALGRRPHGARLGASLAALRPADTAAIAAALEATDTTHLRHRRVTELSGGEQARVLIARALAQASPILIADEPTSGLDPAHQLALAATLTAHARRGGTVVVALHDLSLAARIADLILVLHAGRVARHAPPAEALAPPELARVFGIVGRLAHIDDVPLVVTHDVVKDSSRR